MWKIRSVEFITRRTLEQKGAHFGEYTYGSKTQTALPRVVRRQCLKQRGAREMWWVCGGARRATRCAGWPCEVVDSKVYDRVEQQS